MQVMKDGEGREAVDLVGVGYEAAEMRATKDRGKR